MCRVDNKGPKLVPMSETHITCIEPTSLTVDRTTVALKL